MNSPVTIVEDNLSVAWAKAFLEVMYVEEIAPLVVVIRFLDNGAPPEVPAIREAVDYALEADGKGLSCHTVANTIFPSMWNPEAERQKLYDRYCRILPRVRRYRGNRYGLYFERLIAFGHDGNGQGGVNQLEHIIQTWNGGNHRRTALQASLFDPRRDHTHQRQRGFPCLQQVAFAPDGVQGLAVTGFYATQHIFERAYGNYLGLYRLGRFMAHEMGLRLIQVTCIATPAVRDRPKSVLERLSERVRAALRQVETPAVAGGDARG
ncbi:MAG: thymidylate synthase [Deltaproteobacteria bacterium]|nr:thymidylate synthase [Deltaproteobacteria bacterium]